MKYSYLPEMPPNYSSNIKIAAKLSNIRMLSNANANFVTFLLVFVAIRSRNYFRADAYTTQYEFIVVYDKPMTSEFHKVV